MKNFQNIKVGLCVQYAGNESFKHYRVDTFPNADKVKIEKDGNKIVLDIQDLKQCNSIQNLDIILNYSEPENNGTTEERTTGFENLTTSKEVIFKENLGSNDFNKQIITTYWSSNEIMKKQNCITMIVSLHIKGKNNQNSFNLTLIDFDLKKSQDGTATLTIGDFCGTNPGIEVGSLAPTTILENSHLDTNKVEGMYVQ